MQLEEHSLLQEKFLEDLEEDEIAHLFQPKRSKQLQKINPVIDHCHLQVRNIY